MQKQLLRVGHAFVLAAVVVSSVAQAQTFKFSTLYNFKNNGTDPAGPIVAPTLDAAGNVYGTSLSGGGSADSGTVFKVSKTGTLTVLHTFNSLDGGYAASSLVRDRAGNLYSTTGGSQLTAAASEDACCGVVFKLDPSNQETILHYFTPDDFSPSNVILDAAGNIYGVSTNGGASTRGSVFKIDSAGNYTILYSFCPRVNSCPDGEYPYGRMVRDRAGNLYGTTLTGGNLTATYCGGGCGTVFKLSPDGVETVLHAFNGADGREPSALTQDNLGNLYGVTVYVNGDGAGTLFRQPQAGGSATILYYFCSRSNCTDGGTPIGPVQLDSAGNLYGTAFYSADSTGSVVWKFDTAGNESVLHTFPKNVVTDGGVTIDSAGNLYGFTNDGGPAQRGSVYKLTRQ